MIVVRYYTTTLSYHTYSTNDSAVVDNDNSDDAITIVSHHMMSIPMYVTLLVNFIVQGDDVQRIQHPRPP